MRKVFYAFGVILLVIVLYGIGSWLSPQFQESESGEFPGSDETSSGVEIGVLDNGGEEGPLSLDLENLPDGGEAVLLSLEPAIATPTVPITVQEIAASDLFITFRLGHHDALTQIYVLRKNAILSLEVLLEETCCRRAGLYITTQEHVADDEASANKIYYLSFPHPEDAVNAMTEIMSYLDTIS